MTSLAAAGDALVLSGSSCVVFFSTRKSAARPDAPGLMDVVDAHGTGSLTPVPLPFLAATAVRRFRWRSSIEFSRGRALLTRCCDAVRLWTT